VSDNPQTTTNARAYLRYVFRFFRAKDVSFLRPDGRKVSLATISDKDALLVAKELQAEEGRVRARRFADAKA
jgi:hypothetical protein